MIPIKPGQSEVTCKFCNNTYEIVRPHGKPSPELGWFLAGAVVGFLIGWPASRALLAATAKVSITELEKKVKEWGKR